MELIFEPLYYKMYVITLEDRNQRIIMRSIEPLSQEQEILQARTNMVKIRDTIQPAELYLQGVKM